MKQFLSCLFLGLIALGFVSCGKTDAISEVLDRVEKLEISRNGYTLGKALTESQKKIAETTNINEAYPNTKKFADGNLIVVVHEKTDRVIVLLESDEKASPEKVESMVGELFLEFSGPTTMAHENTLYWAYDSQGKILEKAFSQAKKDNTPLEILATVKFTSDKKIISVKETGETAGIYLIISSGPALELLKAS